MLAKAGESMNLIRVFPRKTKATPDDRLAFYGPPDLLAYAAEPDAVHVSVTFSADKPRAEKLAEQWQHIAPTSIGGRVYGEYDLEFTPGLYIKPGYLLTSRGCPRRCWFCDVWKRRPDATPIPVLHDGWNVLDDNLLACPEWHVRRVFAMLSQQQRQVCFTGGLEALSLEDYHVHLLSSLKPRPRCFFAYDPGDAFDTLVSAAHRMLAAGFTQQSHGLRVYVLIGYPFDTFRKAEIRLRDMLRIGFTPHAMLWQPDTPSAEKWRPAPEWRAFQRQWVRPTIIHARHA
jgi:hypothetical protein